MLITDKKVLREYSETKRLWQGIPSIEVTEKGRVFLTFYSGGTREEIGNFSLLFVSDDGGKTFDEPIAVAYEEGCRCFDPCLWIDPLGRLWFTWAKYPDDGEFAVICNDPDAETLVFGEPFRIGRDVMMNKPTVLSSGEWLFPIAVWKKSLCKNYPGYGADITDKGAYVYMTEDQGRSFQKLGFVDAKKRSADEHMLLELQEGTLRMFIRTDYGIAAADSHDGGITWSEDYDSGYGGPCSRFHIRRLASGRILLINHYEFDGRNNLTAMLSEDEGKTFPYRLLLDERNDVSYPDAKEADDGFIYITYDRDRGAFKWKMRDIFASEREILTAKITEEDILAGKLINEKSYLKHVVSKLGEYDGDIKNPFHEPDLEE